MFALIGRSLRHYWRTHLGVFLGTALASAVLTGALLVGDSVDYSLRSFATQRLGGVDHVIATRTQFLNESLATDLDSELDATVTGMLHLRGMAINPGATQDDRVQVNQVEVLGIRPAFSSFADGVDLELGQHDIAINEKLATALNVTVGEEIAVRITKPSLMSRDAPLSWSNDERSKRRRYSVDRVLADDELGRFSLTASQVSPYNAFVNLEYLQELVELESRVNMVLFSSGTTKESITSMLNRHWQASYIGVQLREHSSGVVQLESERIYLAEETARAATTIPGATPTLTYLVNSLSKDGRSTPYSFVLGGPVPQDMGDDEVVINRWLAEELGADVGDEIEIEYAELQPDGSFVDLQRKFRVHLIREMNDLQTERELMPTFPGLSDVESCTDWDVGMPLDEDVLNDEANEMYWDEYGQTPKALVTLAAAQEMWTNRFGNTTSIRYAADEISIDEVAAVLAREMDPEAAGVFPMAAREQALNAVNEAMDFGGLFLGMSFFLIVAELMLTGLLFVFGVQQRAPEMGLLLSVGYTPKQVRRLWLTEGGLIAITGSVAGLAVASLYTQALLYGLSTYWQGAVANAAIQYHSTATTMVIGAVSTAVCAIIVMALAMRRQFRKPARDLLSMDLTQSEDSGQRSSGTLGLILSVTSFVAAIGIIVGSLAVGVVELMIPFFAAGTLMLLSDLGLFRAFLIRVEATRKPNTFSVRTMALQNVARRRGRSLTVAGLLACGCFMVFAVAAMQEDLYATAHHRASGTGGYTLFAESTFPVIEDPQELLETPGVDISSIKVRDGDDASCLNLNQAQSPRILGVNVEELRSVGAFTGETGGESMWDLLELDLPSGEIPALVGDSNTALWTLKKRTGVEQGAVLEYRIESGEEIGVKLVGALPVRLSIFQGTILISEKHFTQLFPGEAGYRMMLIDVPHEAEDEVAKTLTRELDRYGIDVMPPVERLLEFYSVETTYLAMFLVLGGMGLAVGSVGMGVVVLRNLLERRRELAMLFALGFTREQVNRMLVLEYSILLGAGLLIGILSAGVATVPAVLATASTIDLTVQARVAMTILLMSSACMVGAITMGLRSTSLDALRNE